MTPRATSARAGARDQARTTTRSRILITVLGLDQHEAGALVVARMLRDAGIEVIYSGRFNLPETIAESARQEDVDVVGISVHSWEFLHYAPELSALLLDADPPIPIVVGGSIITQTDRGELTAHGLHVVPAGASEREIVATFESLARRRWTGEMDGTPPDR
jgi:methylmalonyl-CoA mutase, C-terminal domain